MTNHRRDNNPSLLLLNCRIYPSIITARPMLIITTSRKAIVTVQIRMTAITIIATIVQIEMMATLKSHREAITIINCKVTVKLHLNT